MWWSALLLQIYSAQAATIPVSQADASTFGDLLDAAVDGDVFELEPGLNPFRIHHQIVFPAGADITIRSMGDIDVDHQDVQIIVEWYDFYHGAGGPPTVWNNRAYPVMVVDVGGSLTIEGVMMQESEYGTPYYDMCQDGVDNDGNGEADSQDDQCIWDSAFPDDTAIETGFNRWYEFYSPGPVVRVFDVRAGGTISFDRAWFQGWNHSRIGGVVYADNATVNIESSWFHYNGRIVENGYRDYWNLGHGGVVYATNESTVNLQYSDFYHNATRRGAVVYADFGTDVTVEGCGFKNNETHEGTLFVDAEPGATGGLVSTLNVYRSFFAGNKANLNPTTSDHIWEPHKGGAIFAEDSEVVVRNNVFNENFSLDYGAAIFVRRQGGGTPPDIYQNTFAGNFTEFPGGAVLMFDDTTFSFWNNILSHSPTGAIGAFEWDYGTLPDVEYNDIWNTGETYTAELSELPLMLDTNFSADPKFVFWRANTDVDYRVWSWVPQPDSPVLNAGDPAVLDVGGTRSDLGAYGGPDPISAQDVDGDGWEDIYDCDDNDTTIHPEAEETCDELDNDCDGLIDETKVAWYADVDWDGFGDENATPIERCPEESLPAATWQWVKDNSDCDDNEVRVHPYGKEVCDELDNDCLGGIDDGIPPQDHFRDEDGDGFGDGDPAKSVYLGCPPPGYSALAGDCDDADDSIHPLITLEARTIMMFVCQ